MVTFILQIICGLVSLFMIIISVHRQKQKNQLYLNTKAARELGLSYIKKNSSDYHSVDKRWEGFHLKGNYPDAHEVSIEIRIEKAAWGLHQCTVYLKKNLDAMALLGMGKTDIETGDKKFDKAIFLKTKNPLALLGLLSFHTRMILLHIAKLSRYLKISSNKLKVNYRRGNIKDEIVQLKELMTALSRTDPVDKLLFTNFLEEDQIPVRCANLQALLENFPTYRTNKVLLNSAEASRSPRIKFIVFRFVKEWQTPAFFEELWQSSSPKLQESVLNFLTELKNPVFLPSLQTFYQNAAPNLKILILKIFELTSDSQVHDFLVRELGQSDARLQLAAINALGTCGKLEALESLVKINNMRLNGSVKKTVARIQSRFPGRGGKGALSLTRSQLNEGALSMGRDQQGELSINE